MRLAARGGQLMEWQRIALGKPNQRIFIANFLIWQKSVLGQTSCGDRDVSECCGLLLAVAI